MSPVFTVPGRFDGRRTRRERRGVLRVGLRVRETRVGHQRSGVGCDRVGRRGWACGVGRRHRDESDGVRDDVLVGRYVGRVGVEDGHRLWAPGLEVKADLVVKLPQAQTYYAFVVSAPSASYGVEKESAFGSIASQVLVLPAPS